LQNDTADAKLTGFPAYADRRQSWIDGRSAGSEAVLIWNDETSIIDVANSSTASTTNYSASDGASNSYRTTFSISRQWISKHWWL